MTIFYQKNKKINKINTLQKNLLKNKNKVWFILDANDFHGTDWALKVKQINPKASIFVLSDTFDCSNKRPLKDQKIITKSIFNLRLYKKDLFSKIGNLWRNAVKICGIPFFLFHLKKIAKKQNIVFHAHSMYYIFICALANVRFIGTPMGSDVLVRPDNSKVYKIFCTWSLKRASNITVDSRALYKKVYLLSKKKAKIIQNGISTAETLPFRNSNTSKKLLISPRAIDINYRVKNIVEARNRNNIKDPLVLFYPYVNKTYLGELKLSLKKNDINLGRISKKEMYSLYSQALAVFSIPESDSSPRSVYEAIFCGAPVCTVSALWVDDLPSCMRARVILCDLKNPNWISKALQEAKKICRKKYRPSMKAIKTYDEKNCMKNVIEKFYAKN